MLRSSIPAGRLFGVEFRLHVSFPVLLALATVYAALTTENAMRGVALWLALVFAVAVRETARAIAAAYAGFQLRAVFLLSVGGIMAFAPRRGGPADTRPITAAGPAANFLLGALMMGACYGFQPGLHLFAQPWVSVHHLLSSFIWMQITLGVVGLLPSAMPRRAVREGSAPEPNDANASAARAGSFSLGAALALGVTVIGILMMNLWVVLLGGFMLLWSQINTAQTPATSPETDSIRVRDVMLTEYTLLSASDTVTSALETTVHSLQDVFPVVRGDRLVGSVARATLFESLQVQGDSYLQSLMTRTLQMASPEERLVDALRRSSSLGSSEFIPVVEDGAMLGILTPQSLSRAVQVVKPRFPHRA